jgi:hypothetical protein
MDEGTWMAEFKAELVRRGIAPEHLDHFIAPFEYEKLREGFEDRPAEMAARLMSDSAQILRLIQQHDIRRETSGVRLWARVLQGAIMWLGWGSIPIVVVYLVGRLFSIEWAQQVLAPPTLLSITGAAAFVGGVVTYRHLTRR